MERKMRLDLTAEKLKITSDYDCSVVELKGVDWKEVFSQVYEQAGSTKAFLDELDREIIEEYLEEKERKFRKS